MPNTFKQQSIQVLGYSADMTKTTVEYVTTLTIQKMLQYKTPEQVALGWNAGNAKKCSKGVNSLGVPYDSCLYVIKTINNYNKLK